MLAQRLDGVRDLIDCGLVENQTGETPGEMNMYERICSPKTHKYPNIWKTDK